MQDKDVIKSKRKITTQWISDKENDISTNHCISHYIAWFICITD